MNYRFHNPNPPEVTADYILEILIEANSEKVERAIQEIENQVICENKYQEEDSA
ncbi:hypothetical protein [Eubacterium ramulus]